MSTTSSFPAPQLPESRSIFADAIGYWERRRIIYNSLLATVVVTWILATWPHFRPAFTWYSLRFLVVSQSSRTFAIALRISPICPCSIRLCAVFWRRWRWSLFLAGTLFAILFANYWIADEIYSYVSIVH